MELIKVSVLLFAVGVSVAMGCSQEAVMNCVQGASEIGTMAASVAQNPENAKEMCRKLNEFQTCLQNAMSSCSADMKKNFEQMTASFDMANQMCDESDQCSMIHLLKCAEGMPMTEAESQNIDYKKVCSHLPKTMTCVDNMNKNCQSSPFTAGLQQASQSFPAMDAECKKMYGDDYASKQSAGDGNSGRALEFSLLASLVTLLVAIFLK